MEEFKRNLKTGDLILFDSQNSGLFWLFDKAIKLFTGSDYNHIADEIDWSILRPSDFSIEDKNEHLQYNAGFKLADDQIEYQV